MKKVGTHIRRYFLAGLLVWVPIIVTLFIIQFIVEILDKTVAWIPQTYQPEHWLGVNIPGLGVIFSITIVFVTGLLITNFIGRWFVHIGESIVARIPLVRAIYNGVKQVLHTIFSSQGNSFRQVLLVQYPRKGLWSIAFQTGDASPIIENNLGEKMVTLFVPTTPNPTSGFLIMASEKDVIKLDMSIDNALKMVISLGVVQPHGNQNINGEPTPKTV